jgi:hypothetical protein
MTTRGWVTLTGVCLAVTCYYALSCRWWPWKPCSRCHGEGRLSRSDGRVFRPCPRCKGTGRRLRAGRWIYHRITGTEGPQWS